ncbi:MAG: tetratricopeptide repeat protein [Chitinophagaceae bacterium]|nr:tetratricopeptide repeat protein [Chitinophagaceae bacterium]
MYKETQKDDLLFAYYARGLSNYQLKKKANAVADLEKALEYGPNSNDVKTWLEKAKALPDVSFARIGTFVTCQQSNPSACLIQDMAD